jgi:hypothetical protein
MITFLLLAIISILVFLAGVYIIRLTKSVKIMKKIIKEKEVEETEKNGDENATEI